MTLVRDHGGWVTPQHTCPRAPYFTPLRGKEQGRLFLAEALGRQHSVWPWKPSLMMAIPLWGTVSLVSDLQGTGHFPPGPGSVCLTLAVLPVLHLSCQSQPGPGPMYTWSASHSTWPTAVLGASSWPGGAYAWNRINLGHCFGLWTSSSLY